MDCGLALSGKTNSCSPSVAFQTNGLALFCFVGFALVVQVHEIHSLKSVKQMDLRSISTVL